LTSDNLNQTTIELLFDSLIFNSKIKLYVKESTLDTFRQIENGQVLLWTLLNNQISDASPFLNLLSKEWLGDIVFDVGANCGFTSIFFARRAGRVFAFEPDDKNYDRAMDLISGLKPNNLEFNKMAVSEIDGKVSFFLKKEMGHHSMVNTDKAIQSIKVDSCSLDTFCKDRKIDTIDFLKVDVEGAELNVFIGAKELLSERKVKKILFEHNQSTGNSESIYKLLNDFGYRITSLSGKHISLADLQSTYHSDYYAFPI